MLILVEGPNASGKTTLVEKLVRHLKRRCPTDKVKVIHRGPPTLHPVYEYVYPLLDYRPERGEHIICDRWHWGELVYPRLLDRPTMMDVGVWRYVEMFLRSRGATVAYPYVEVSILQRRLRTRGDDLVSPALALDESRAFTAARGRSSLPVTILWREPVWEDIDRLLQLGKIHSERASVLNDLVTYVGPPQPSHLLVGDTRNDRDTAPTLGPAFGPLPGTSGHYLLNSLPEDTSRGIMNANDVDSLANAWTVLGKPPVTTLGVNATRRARACGIACSSVPHPQFVRRFLHRYGREYGQLIKTTREDALSWRP